MRIAKLTLLVALLNVILPLTATAGEHSETSYWGPVVLSEGKRFEVCASAPEDSVNFSAQVRFVRVADGAAVAEALRLDPGRGGCVPLYFEQAGSEPIFALLEVDAASRELDLVASAAVINGIFESPVRRYLSEDEGQRVVTTYGPLRLRPNKRLQVCAHNPRNFAGRDPSLSIPVSFVFYDTENSAEPFSVHSGEIEPGEGSCVTVDEKMIRDRSFYAEVWTDPAEPGYSNPAAMTGAFVINGFFDTPIPPSAVHVAGE